MAGRLKDVMAIVLGAGSDPEALRETGEPIEATAAAKQPAAGRAAPRRRPAADRD